MLNQTGRRRALGPPGEASAPRRRRRRQWLWRVGLCLGLLAALAFPRSLTAQISVGRLKSLFVERFTRFIEWPAGALGDGAPFVVCIQGTGDTADNLSEVASSRKFKERPCEVRRVRAGSDLSSCHLLYLAATEAPRLAQTLEAVAAKPILTVSDSSGFAEKGVLINLFQEERLMRFEINFAAVKRSKLTFSSQLLRLGRLVGAQSPLP